MGKSEMLDLFKGRRKCKTLVSSSWEPTPDFVTLSDHIYDHILRTDRSNLSGLPTVDVRKYLNWWKLRTHGRNLEFTGFPLNLDLEEEEAAVCYLFEAAGTTYKLEKVHSGKVATLDKTAFACALLFNCRLDPYECIKCFNETTQSSDFRTHADKKIIFETLPRSLLPELPDIRARAIFEEWKWDIVSALRKERSRRSSRRARSRSRSPESRSRKRERERYRESRGRSLSPDTFGSKSRSRRKKRQYDDDDDEKDKSSSGSRSRASSPSRKSKSEIVRSQPAPSNQPRAEFDWRVAAWSVGSRVLDELLGVIRREHHVRSEQRQVNGQILAANAQTTNQLWSTAAALGTWGAQALVISYFGPTLMTAQRLIQSVT